MAAIRLPTVLRISRTISLRYDIPSYMSRILNHGPVFRYFGGLDPSCVILGAFTCGNLDDDGDNSDDDDDEALLLLNPCEHRIAMNFV